MMPFPTNSMPQFFLNEGKSEIFFSTWLGWLRAKERINAVQIMSEERHGRKAQTNYIKYVL